MTIRQFHLSAIAAAAAAAAASFVKRGASTLNVLSPQTYSIGNATNTDNVYRLPFFLGTCDWDELQVSVYNWIFGTYGVQFSSGTNFDILEMCIEIGAQYKTVTWGGSPSVTVVNGSTDVSSDPILPSDFSLSYFAKSTEGYIRFKIRGDNTMKWPSNMAPSASTRYRFNPATGACPVYGVGNLSASGTYSQAPDPFRPVLIGRPRASGKFLAGIGDSIAAYVGDSAGAVTSGYAFTRAAYTDYATRANPLACINFGVPGGTILNWIGDRTNTPANASATATNIGLPEAYLKYANLVFEQYGTNGTYQTGSGVYAHTDKLWTVIKRGSVGCKLVRSSLFPRTADNPAGSADEWATVASQVPSQAPGTDTDLFEQYCAGKVGAGLVDYYINYNAPRANTNRANVDYYKWAVNGTANWATKDGLHPESAMHGLMYQGEARTLINTISTDSGYVTYPYRKTNEGLFMISRTGETPKTAYSAVGNVNVPIGGYLTSHVCIKAPAHFDEVALVFGNSTGTARTISGFSVAPGATMSDMTNSSAVGRSNFVAGSFGGSPGVTVGAGTDALCTYVKSDFIACSSVARAAGDAATWSIAGGKLADAYVEPLLHIRVAFQIDGVDQATANATPMLGTLNAGVTNAEQPFNPPQPSASGSFIACTQSTNAAPQLSVGSATALTGTVYGPFTGIVFCPVIGVVFKFRGNVVCVATPGDSISQGAGLTGDKTERPWTKIGAEKRSTMSAPIVQMPLYKSGQSSTTYLAYLSNCISQGLVPTHAVFPVGTPNDGGVNLTNLAAFFSLCSANNIHPIVWTMLPVGQIAPQKYTNPATELARIAANNSVRTGTVTGSTYSWMEMELPSLTDGATPYASIPAGISDAIRLHPNNDGNAIMQAVFESKLTDLKAQYFP